MTGLFLHGKHMQKQLGINLIELLISLFILSIMLLGLDALQITALREAVSTYYFNVATEQLNVMAERLHTFKDNNLDEQLMIWNEQNRNVLPKGRGEMSGQYPDIALTIFWGMKSQKTCHKNTIGQSGCLRLSVLN